MNRNFTGKKVNKATNIVAFASFEIVASLNDFQLYLFGTRVYFFILFYNTIGSKYVTASINCLRPRLLLFFLKNK